MLKPEFTGQFKKDYKLVVKRGCDPNKLEVAITLLCISREMGTLRQLASHPFAPIGSSPPRNLLPYGTQGAVANGATTYSRLLTEAWCQALIYHWSDRFRA